MDFLKDLDQKITQIGKSAVNTTKNLTESARINSEIAAEEERLETYYAAMGQLYLQKQGNEVPEAYQSFYQAIVESERKVEQMKTQAQVPQSQQASPQPQPQPQPEPQAQSQQAQGQQDGAAAPPPQNNLYIGYQMINEDQLPAKFAPLGPWAYFGWMILFSLPFVGWIIALVKAFGNTENVNLRNFARSMFCYICVIAILSIFIFGTAGCMAGMASL